MVAAVCRLHTVGSELFRGEGGRLVEPFSRIRGFTMGEQRAGHPPDANNPARSMRAIRRWVLVFCRDCVLVATLGALCAALLTVRHLLRWRIVVRLYNRQDGRHRVVRTCGGGMGHVW